jgi:3-hydroxypropanoate dehydrogenase
MEAVIDPFLDQAGCELLFTNARTANRFTDRPVDQPQLRKLYDLMKWGPTSMNSCPARLCFLTTEQAKARLLPALFDGNVKRVRSAPVVTIIGHDLEFFDHLPRLYPPAPENRRIFEHNEIAAEATAFRNAALQGAYFMIAARAVGLDCGPMSGFDNARVDQEFFAGTNVRSNFLCSLGYADAAAAYPRAPRFDFEEICQIL